MQEQPDVCKNDVMSNDTDQQEREAIRAVLFGNANAYRRYCRSISEANI